MTCYGNDVTLFFYLTSFALQAGSNQMKNCNRFNWTQKAFGGSYGPKIVNINYLCRTKKIIWISMYTKQILSWILGERNLLPCPLLIDGRIIEIVQHFKFLDATISNNLKWELSIDTIVKKVQQRLYFRRG